MAKRGPKVKWTEKRVNALVKKINHYVRECASRSIEVIPCGEEGPVKILGPKLAMIEDCLRKNRVNVFTVYHLRDKFSQLDQALKRIQDIQKEMLINFTLQGAYQSTFAIFAAKNMLGWRDERYGPLVDQSKHTHYTIQNLAKDVDGNNRRIEEPAQESLPESGFVLGESLKRDAMEEAAGNHGSGQGQSEGNGKVG